MVDNAQKMENLELLLNSASSMATDPGDKAQGIIAWIWSIFEKPPPIFTSPPFSQYPYRTSTTTTTTTNTNTNTTNDIVKPKAKSKAKTKASSSTKNKAKSK